MFKPEDIQVLASYIELSVMAGKPWTLALREIAAHGARKRIARSCQKLQRAIEELGAQKALDLYSRQSKKLEVKLFFQSLKTLDAADSSSRQAFRECRRSFYEIDQLRKKERSVSFLPRVQAVMNILICLGMVLGLPKIFPQFQMSFLQQGRTDLFILGWLLMTWGFLCLSFILWWPSRHQKTALRLLFFLRFVSVSIASGRDLNSSWRESRERMGFSRTWNKRLELVECSYENMINSFRKIGQQTDEPWNLILSGMAWVLETGNSISDFLNESIQQVSKDLFMGWEESQKRASFFALLPLYFICFPACLFLLLGPLLMHFGRV